MSVAVDLTGLVLPEALEELKRSADGNRASVLLQPLERGFGHTIGNSVRRILLSSLPGSAVWAFRSDGVQHEHQTIGGVAEDVHQVIQNLKGLVLRLDPDVDEAKLELSVHEAGPVTAARITKHPGAEIVNRDHLLFTLQEDFPKSRPLTMDFWVNRGRGFVMADQHEVPGADDLERAEKEYPVGMIRIDSQYNPVVRANFSVRETRVGQRTDFDRLEVDVETNGALDPGDA
ncbi:MAG: DNA-directed RNA polymerase subunit alpha, partial [Gemmatimonadota bacterium]